MSDFSYDHSAYTKKIPLSVIMITLNEAHNLERCLQNLQNWAGEVHILDSYSRDDTVEIGIKYGAFVYQRKFDSFGGQWNAALSSLPLRFPWTMKIDPDEIITLELKKSIEQALLDDCFDGFSFDRNLLFMGKKLPISQEITRVWRTGRCAFTEVAVNEHPIVTGNTKKIAGQLLHFDSPNLQHWFAKQNAYSTAEAQSLFRNSELSYYPKLWGSKKERRMWFKKNIYKVPFRYFVLFAYYFIILGAWRAGKVGYIWSRLRSDVIRYREYKWYEMILNGGEYKQIASGVGVPDSRVVQISNEVAE